MPLNSGSAWDVLRRTSKRMDRPNVAYNVGISRVWPSVASRIARACNQQHALRATTMCAAPETRKHASTIQSVRAGHTQMHQTRMLALCIACVVVAPPPPPFLFFLEVRAESTPAKTWAATHARCQGGPGPPGVCLYRAGACLESLGGVDATWCSAAIESSGTDVSSQPPSTTAVPSSPPLDKHGMPPQTVTKSITPQVPTCKPTPLLCPHSFQIPRLHGAPLPPTNSLPQMTSTNEIRFCKRHGPGNRSFHTVTPQPLRNTPLPTPRATSHLVMPNP